MDETGVMLCILGSIQVLVSKDDPRDYRGAGVKRTIVTAIECIGANVREKAFTKRNITATWAACGLFPFNPDRVLKKTPKPPTQSTIPRADEIQAGSSHEDEVPQTPVTPVSVEGLASLYNLIKQDALTLNEKSIPRLQRHVQKLANAAQIFFADGALLNDQVQMLTGMNNEAKVRRLTRAVVLGKAKVMSFEDIEVARAARAAKEVIKGKGKRGRKRKSATLEADEPETEVEAEPEVAHAAKEVITGKRKHGRKRKSAVQEANKPEPELE
ncbi:hypothetical protein DL95DRAFT_464657 [Leptodontidium sp. 2 PMI_412]|nr:hypothetical protein DL95DRAFT_464657 [Leptodontidium sp. 2 PMI_412]